MGQEGPKMQESITDAVQESAHKASLFFEGMTTLDPKTLMLQLGLSLLLGMLVGLQRERAKAKFGMRTFPLITILGTISALLSVKTSVWILAIGLLCITAIGIAALLLPIYLQSVLQKNESADKWRENHEGHGTTTLVTTLVMYLVGAMLANPAWNLLALEVGGITAVLLQFKLELHHIADRLGESEMKAIMQFVMITFIILPVLPNKSFGPYNSFNPFETWLMVVLIVGMSLTGYIIYKFFGERAGIFLGGILGGAISSTAMTFCYSKMVKEKVVPARVAALVLMIASTFLVFRTMIMIYIISPEFLARCLLSLTIFMIASFLPAVLLWGNIRDKSFAMAEQSNPTQWSSALTFGLLYALIAFGMKAGAAYFGNTGLCFVAAISGFTETSAVTISTARMAATDSDIMLHGWRLILIGLLSNTIFKLGATFLLAGIAFGMRILLLYLIPLLAGTVILYIL